MQDTDVVHELSRTAAKSSLNTRVSLAIRFLISLPSSLPSPPSPAHSLPQLNVRVNIKGDGLTVNIVKWTYFVNTNPRKCVAFGTGLFADSSDNCGWGFPAIFKVKPQKHTFGDALFVFWGAQE
jgi:hypothetical protein